MTDEKAPSLRRRLLDGWMVIAGRFGSVQTLMILALTYVLLIGPVGLAQAVEVARWRDFRSLIGL